MIDRPFRGSWRAFLPGSLLLFVLTAAVPVSAIAAASLQDEPHWSVEIKGGYFYPEIENWSAYYGDDRTWQIAGAAAFKFFRWAEIGIEGGMIQDRGVGYAPLNNIMTGRVIYQLYPVSAYMVLRGIISEEQWLVPYVGGGYTKMYYRQKVEGQGYVRGSTDGYHGRAGLQLLLDNLDRNAANRFYLDYGIFHTYFFFEAQLTKANVDTTAGASLDLGGTSYLWGLLFEF